MSEERSTIGDPTARAVYRIVRALHDGVCPKCYYIFRGPNYLGPDYKIEACPRPHCTFSVTPEEFKAAMELFGPSMKHNLEIFETWRKTLS